MQSSSSKKVIIMGLIVSQIFSSVSASTGTDMELSGSDSSVTNNSFLERIQTRSDFMTKLASRDKEALATIYQDTLPQDEVDLKSAKLQIDDISSQLTDISDQFTQISDKRKLINDKYNEVKWAIKQIIDQSLKTKNIITERMVRLNLYTKKQIEIRWEIGKTQDDIDQTKNLIVRFTTILYKINNDFYTNDLNIDDIKLLVKSESIANTLSSEELVKVLTMRFDQLMQTIVIKQQELVNQQKVLNDFRMKFKIEVTTYKQEIELLSQQKTYLLEFLNLYRQDKISLDLTADGLQWDKNKLEQEMAGILKSGESYLSTNTSSKLQLLNARDHKSLTGDNYFGWPVLPIVSIVGAFNDLKYVDMYGTGNKGINIGVEQFSPVYAPANGIIYKIRDKNGISLNYIIIIHKGWYVSLLTKLNQISVAEWQLVGRGQLIGISGGEPGTRGAWFLSDGPNLHIELYKDGKQINPLTVMDLSVIARSSAVPLELDIKYLKDKLMRSRPVDTANQQLEQEGIPFSVDMSQVQFVEGNSLTERRKNFLALNGFGEFADLSVREDAARWHSVDVDVGICIAVAESSMGRNLSSARNVGNVGNNDRGDRIDLWSAVEWASMIFYALENEYLGKYHTLYDLSGYGNQYGPIYASSPINRQTNITRCLSSIKGYRIPEEYMLRLPKN